MEAQLGYGLLETIEKLELVGSEERLRCKSWLSDGNNKVGEK
jgi:hypothetical protein